MSLVRCGNHQESEPLLVHPCQTTASSRDHFVPPDHISHNNNNNKDHTIATYI